jgi:hypothetical protein
MYLRMGTLSLFLLSYVWAFAEDKKPEIPDLKVETFTITVRGTPEPVPALKYQLLPMLNDMQPGNPIRGYLKCFMEQDYLYANKQVQDEREKLLNAPLSELTDGTSGYGGSSSRNADYAARLTTPDWEILPEFRRDGIGLLLPEVQKIRSLAGVLKLRLRGQIKENKFDEAVYSLQTIFNMSRHMDVHPTLISHLVGTAITTSSFSAIDEFISQPGSPNLFWAFTYTPKPLLSLERGIQGERMMVMNELKAFTDARHPWTKEEFKLAKEKFSNIASVFGNSISPSEKKIVDEWLPSLFWDETFLSKQRKKLVDAGFPADQVKLFHPEQLTLHYLKEQILIRLDESLKWMFVPTPESIKYIQAFEESKYIQSKAPEDIAFNLVILSNFRFRIAQVRTEQRLAMYQVIEAIRLHLNTNKELPKQLKDIKYPLPLDPVSGKEFLWELNNQGGLLSGEIIPGSAIKTWGAAVAPLQHRYQLVVGK